MICWYTIGYKAVYANTLPVTVCTLWVLHPLPTSKGKDAQITFKFRLLGKVFRISETFGLYESSYEADRPYLPMPEKTDLKVSAISSSSGTDVSAQFGILLIKNQL